VLADPDPTWADTYRQIAADARTVLGDRVRLIEHVGSTSVPGLCAKPIIDIVLDVKDSADEAAYVPDLEDAGWVLRVREPEWFEHRMLGPAHGGAHLHVFTAGCRETRRMLRFRDWLRAHPEDRDRYAAAKRALAARRWTYLQQYADAKGSIVGEILARAEAEEASSSAR
jgi:GrpB-like predicted nucleotidyltransferase (UPF0157 family)